MYKQGNVCRITLCVMYRESVDRTASILPGVQEVAQECCESSQRCQCSILKIT